MTSPPQLVCLTSRDRNPLHLRGRTDAAPPRVPCAGWQPKYMLPNIYAVLDALPMNANGKIDRVKLKELIIHAEKIENFAHRFPIC